MGTPSPNSAVDRELFASSVSFSIGDGHKAKFWTSCWLGGRVPREFIPSLFLLIKRKGISVFRALQDNSWAWPFGVYPLNIRFRSMRNSGYFSLVSPFSPPCRTQLHGDGRWMGLTPRPRPTPSNSRDLSLRWMSTQTPSGRRRRKENAGFSCGFCCVGAFSWRIGF